MEPPPPPPPPHGANPGNKGSGLPPGNYDIFIIPPHSSGSGFLYLPSLQTHRNSFLAGVGSTLLAVAIWSIVYPVLREWFATIVASGGMAVVVLLIGVGVAGWAWGKTQTETGGPSSGGAHGTGMPNSNSHNRPHTNGFPAGGSMPPGSSQPPPQSPPQSPPQPPPRAAPHNASQSPPSPPQATAQTPPQTFSQAAPAPPPPTQPPPPEAAAPQAAPPPPPPQSSPPPPQTDPRSHSRFNPQPRAPQPPEPSSRPEPRAAPKSTWQRATPEPDAGAPPKSSWQQATTAAPLNGKGKADAGPAKSAWEKAREETRKKEEDRKRMEETRKRAEDLRRKREDDEKEKLKQREKDAREREMREARERREKERELREKARLMEPGVSKTESSASALPQHRKTEDLRPVSPSLRKSENARPESPIRKHHPPTAKTVTEADTHSFRPYDKPKQTAHPATAASSSIYSESSYAPSFSTSRTTPPPSKRGAYRTNDPDKIVLKAVYTFTHAFTKNPVAQLVSGVGSVTDGLILRITTEGLFIDDDVRGVPQREWDVKAWTLKLVEVWCPHLHVSGASSGSSPVGRSSGFFGRKNGTKAISAEESETFLSSFLAMCKPTGMVGAHIGDKSNAIASSQTGESQGLHVLRASIRDQEGKRYVFVLQQEEGWKVAVGLQRLRRGTQVRALGLSGMAPNESKGILENMGWGLK